MQDRDCDRLRSWCGYPAGHLFRPDLFAGDEMILVDKLLSEGCMVSIRRTALGQYICTITPGRGDPLSVSDPTRRGAVCFCALGVCP